MKNIIILSLLNGIIFATYSYLVGYFLLHKKPLGIKKILLASIPFLIMYYCILCLLNSIYAVFFLGLCVFVIIKIIFQESIYVSLLIALIVNLIKWVFKFLILLFINKEEFLLINTYKTLDWNAFYVNLLTLTIAVLFIIIFKKHLRKLIKYISSLKHRKLILLIAIYLHYILIFIYQPPYSSFSLQVITDLLMIFTVTAIGIFNISSEMKMESLNKHYQEIFEYSKANGELLTSYKMQVHENKNRLIMIKEMLDGPKKNVKNYIDTLLKEMNDDRKKSNYWLSELRYIPLPGVRNFINYKLIKLKELGAEIEVFVSSELENINTKTFDEKDYNELSIILGVILDNMIESINETEEKLISLNIFMETNTVKADFVNSYSGKIDLSRLNEIGYTTKGEQHGVGLPLIAKILKSNNRFECKPEIMDNFFIQHLTIKLLDKNNLQKTSKK